MCKLLLRRNGRPNSPLIRQKYEMIRKCLMSDCYFLLCVCVSKSIWADYGLKVFGEGGREGEREGGREEEESGEGEREGEGRREGWMIFPFADVPSCLIL